MSTKITPPQPEPEPQPQPQESQQQEPHPQREPDPKRRRRLLAWAAGGLATLAVAAAIAPFTPLMPVRTIDVAGNKAVDTATVEELTGIAPDTPMGRVDLSAAAHSVAGNPWVKSVTVSRSWPSTIAVTMTEHTAVAYIAESDGTHLIDSEGKDFLVADPPAEAIELVGSGAADEAGRQRGVAIAASISERARGQIAEIDAGSNDVVLHTTDGRTVHWGAPEDNANKALALETVLQMEGHEFNIANPQLVTSR